MLAGMGWVWSTQVDMHFLCSMAWVGFSEHKLICILCASWDGMDLVNTYRDAFRVLAVMGRVCSTLIDMHIVCSLAWDGFGQQILRCIVCPRWHGMCLVNTCSDNVCELAGIEWVWSIHIEILFVSSLALDGFE